MILFSHVIGSDENLGGRLSAALIFCCLFLLAPHPLGKGASCPRQFRDGHLLSILAMIRSAIAMASAMADSSTGEGRPSQFASFLAARMLAAIRRTRLRPSSTGIV